MLLNRRHLRIKVLQELYAFHQTNETDYVKHERELDKSVEKMWDMYILWFSLMIELKEFAERKIEENKKKRLPSEEDLNPNLKFVENKLLGFLSVNRQLNKEIDKLRLNWQDQDEMLKKLYNEIIGSEAYQSYMSEKKRSFEEDRKILVKLFKKQIANFEGIHHLLEEKSIFWLDDIDLVCAMVIKSLKQIDETDDEFSPLPSLFKEDDDEEVFYKTLFRKSIMYDDELSEIINAKTENWELDRIAKMDIILMKMAITEAREFTTIPLKVTLNEYIEISKFYSTPKSNSFINGILDKTFNELKSKGEIKKVGRGLIE